MAPYTATSGNDACPTEQELLDEVAKHPEGIDAVTLGKIFESQGYKTYSIQRVLQRALDNGSLDLGSRFKLRVSQAAA
jgi:hypothetical protein